MPLPPILNRTRRWPLAVACLSLAACGSPSPSGPPGGGATPAPGPTSPDAISWGFFAYTGDLVGGLTNARWRRSTGFVWTEIERVPGSGSYDWNELDARVRAGQATGMSTAVVLKTGNGPSFSDPDCLRRVEAAAAAGDLPAGRVLASCPLRPELESAWGRMVTEVVERYDGDGSRDMPGLVASLRLDIQIENEAANQQLWDYGSERALAAERYLRLLDLSYRAKQEANPQAQVILAGLHEPNRLARCDGQPLSAACPAGVQQNLAFSRRILSRPELFDAVDVHFFVYYHFEPDFVDRGFQWVADQMRQRGYERPIYSLEWTGAMLLHVNEGHVDEFFDYFPYSASFPTRESFQAMYLGLDQPANGPYRRWFEAEQAKEFGKLFTNILALGVSRIIHVQYADYRPGAWNNPWWNWQGIIKYVGGAAVRKPSYHTYNILSERLSGFSAARRIAVADGVRLYEFSFPAREPVYVLWTDAAGTLLDLSRVIPRASLRVTPLVTELDAANGPIVEPETTVPTTAVPAADVPVLLRGV